VLHYQVNLRHVFNHIFKYFKNFGEKKFKVVFSFKKYIPQGLLNDGDIIFYVFSNFHRFYIFYII